MKNIRPFILASGSPRRKELLEKAGADFEVIVSGVEEPSPDDYPTPKDFVMATALLKAQAVAKKNPAEKRWVLAADTVAAQNNNVFGKADDRDHAEEILGTLMGTEHETMTGLALVLPCKNIQLTRYEITVVRMKKLTERQLTNYLDSGDWQGKAGAYAIQIENDRFVEAVEGSFSNVVGLPLEVLPAFFTEAETRANE